MKLAALVALFAIAGCSIVATSGPPPQPRPKSFDCSDSYAVPMLDTLGAVAWLILIYGAASSDANPSDYERGVSHTLAVGGYVLGPVLAFGASAAVGYRRVSRCHDATPGPSRSRTTKDVRREVWQLTQEAVDAARAGDCASVNRLAVEVASLDANFHATVFVRSATLQRCFTPVAP